MRQSTDLDRLNWDKKLCVHIGMKLMDMLVRYGNGWFELSYVKKGYGRTVHTEKTLRLTEVALQAIEQDHQRCELNRPFLLPMLCEPAEWGSMKRKRNPLARDLRSPKYRMRIVRSRKHYSRKLKKGRRWLTQE